MNLIIGVNHIGGIVLFFPHPRIRVTHHGLRFECLHRKWCTREEAAYLEFHCCVCELLTEGSWLQYNIVNGKPTVYRLNRKSKSLAKSFAPFLFFCYNQNLVCDAVQLELHSSGMYQSCVLPLWLSNNWKRSQKMEVKQGRRGSVVTIAIATNAICVSTQEISIKRFFWNGCCHKQAC